MSDTPRVDIVAVMVTDKAKKYLCEPSWVEAVNADFARTLERENAALRADNRKLALHTAEQAKELGKLRDQLEEAQDKALRFDIDSVGIERREAEGAELVTLRAELSAAQARIAELEAALEYLCDLKTMKEALEGQKGQAISLPGGPCDRDALQTYYKANKEAAWKQARAALARKP